MRKGMKLFFMMLLIYFVYFVSSLVVYTKIKISTMVNKSENSISQKAFDFDKATGKHEAVVIHHLEEALAVRCELIDKAQEKIVVTQYSIKDDDSGVIFMGKLLDAAERGVKVELLVNNLSTKMSNSGRTPIKLFQSHPNIAIKGVGGIHLLKPWTMNNVLHDKLIIVDDSYVLSSGRNIENRFLLPKNQEDATYDRDILVHALDKKKQQSIVSQGQYYFQQLWKQKGATLKKQPEFLGEKMNVVKKKFLNDYQQTLSKREKAVQATSIEQLTFVPVDSVKLLTNSVGKTVKYPGVLQALNEYFERAKQEVVIQTPYIIVTNSMETIITNRNADVEAKIITNYEKSSPNLLAISGYEHQKKKIEQQATIYEYIGKGSLHQKAISIDETISMIGSFNFESRSTFLSTENLIVVEGKELNEQLRKSMETNQLESFDTKKETAPEMSFSKKSMIKIVSIFSPLFDFLL